MTYEMYFKLSEDGEQKDDLQLQRRVAENAFSDSSWFLFSSIFETFS